MVRHSRPSPAAPTFDFGTDLVPAGEPGADMAVTEAGRIAFNARLWAQMSLPYNDPGDIPAWVRQNGGLTLMVKPGMRVEDGKAVSIGIPYGTIPRYVLAYVATQAVKTKSREIDIGGSQSAFLALLGMKKSGGVNGSATRLMDQMQRLFSAVITVNALEDTASHTRSATRNLLIAAGSDFTLWKPGSNREGIEGGITLTEEFYREIVDHPVPVDPDALAALRRSPIRMDIYTWLTYRFFNLAKPTVVTWEQLAAQFGGQFGRLSDFRSSFLGHLEVVKSVWPEAAASSTPQGLLLRPCAPHVRPRPTSRRGSLIETVR